MHLASKTGNQELMQFHLERLDSDSIEDQMYLLSSTKIELFLLHLAAL